MYNGCRPVKKHKLVPNLKQQKTVPDDHGDLFTSCSAHLTRGYRHTPTLSRIKKKKKTLKQIRSLTLSCSTTPIFLHRVQTHKGKLNLDKVRKSGSIKTKANNNSGNGNWGETIK